MVEIEAGVLGDDHRFDGMGRDRGERNPPLLVAWLFPVLSRFTLSRAHQRRPVGVLACQPTDVGQRFNLVKDPTAERQHTDKKNPFDGEPTATGSSGGDANLKRSRLPTGDQIGYALAPGGPWRISARTAVRRRSRAHRQIVGIHTERVKAREAYIPQLRAMPKRFEQDGSGGCVAGYLCACRLSAFFARASTRSTSQRNATLSGRQNGNLANRIGACAAVSLLIALPGPKAQVEPSLPIP